MINILEYQIKGLFWVKVQKNVSVANKTKLDCFKVQPLGNN